MSNNSFQPNVILVDADYAGRVAFDLIVNFERMLGRRIPPADLAHWLDCLALDGGLRPGANAVQVVFVHDKQTTKFPNFSPDDFATDLDAKAFKDNLGEFTLHSVAVEDIVSRADFFTQVLTQILTADTVERLMVVADMDDYGDSVCRVLAQSSGKFITLFGMQPLTGRGFMQEILGYSLMSALGISGEELK